MGRPTFQLGVSDYADNAYPVELARSDAGTFIQASPGSRVIFDTTADWMVMDTYNDLGLLNGFPGVGVRVDGVDVGEYKTGNATAQKFSVPLGTRGVSKAVEIINGLQSVSTGTRKGEWVTGIWLNDDTYSAGAPTTTPRIFVYGDSIAGGQSADNPSLQGWVQLLRNTYAATGSVLSEGVGSTKLKLDGETEEMRTAFVSHIASVSPTIIWLAIGALDQAAWTAAAFETAYADFLDKLHAALPSAAIYAQTPIQKATEGDMADYRTAISNAQSSRAAWCTLVDGTDAAFPQPADLAVDGLHPTTAGQAMYAAAVIAILGLS